MSSWLQLFHKGIEHASRGELQQAEQLWNKAKAILERDLPDSIELANLYQNLARCHDEQKHPDEAIRYYHLSEAIKERKTPNDSGLGDLYFALSVLYSVEKPPQQLQTEDEKKRQATSVSYLKKALLIHEKYYPADSMELANNYHSCGTQCTDPSEKLFYYRKALPIYLKKIPNSLELAELYNSLGYCEALGRKAKYYKKALPILERLAPDSLSISRTYFGLGALTHEPNQKIKYLEKAVSIRERKDPNNNLTLAAIHHNLEIVYVKCGELEMARQYHCKARSYQLAGEKEYASNLDWAGLFDQWADDFRDVENPEEAIKYYSLALEIYKKHAPNHPDIATIEGKKQVQMNVLRLNKVAKQLNVGIIHKY